MNNSLYVDKLIILLHCVYLYLLRNMCGCHSVQAFSYTTYIITDANIISITPITVSVLFVCSTSKNPHHDTL